MDTTKKNSNHFDSKENDFTDGNACKIPTKKNNATPLVNTTNSSSMKSETLNVDSKVVDLEKRFEGLQLNSLLLLEVKEPSRNVNALVQNASSGILSSSSTDKFHNETPVTAQTELKCPKELQTSQVDYEETDSQDAMASSMVPIPIMGQISKGKLGNKPAEKDAFRLQTKHIRINNKFTQTRRYKHTHFDSNGRIIEDFQVPTNQERSSDNPTNVYYPQTNDTDINVTESNQLPIIEKTLDDKIVDSDRQDRQQKKKEPKSILWRGEHTYFDIDGNAIQTDQHPAKVSHYMFDTSIQKHFRRASRVEYLRPRVGHPQKKKSNYNKKSHRSDAGSQ